MSKTNFYSILVNLTTTNAALDMCKDFFQSKSNRLYFINAHCYNIACKNRSYKEALNNAELVMNDGIGVKIAFKLKKINVPENMNGTDFIPKLIEKCASLNKKVYLLGAKEGITDKAKQNLVDHIENLQIVGCHSGYINKDELTSVIDEINTLNTDVLIVGMGVPMQELWIEQNKDRLPCVSLFVAGGAILDFMAGSVKRAPKWIQKAGIEWLFRFIQEPFRLFKRYFIGNIVFFYNIFNHRKAQ